MTTSRRLAPLPLLLIGLAALAVLVLIPWVVHAQTTNQSATGRPVVLASAQGAGILFADTEGIADGNGRPIVIATSGVGTFAWTYQWIRVDGNSQTNVGANSDTYQPVEADVGKLIKVEVSFTDGDNFSEAVTSLPFGPIAEPPPSGPLLTLVSNTGQSPSSTANITQQYAVGFRLGDHGQGYDISSVSIDLAAVPSDLTVSLWSGGVGFPEVIQHDTASKLFDFANPSSFVVGLNEFTAPAGAFAYPNVNYFIVLSGFGTTLSIEETTSDNEDAGGEPGAVIYDQAAVRALSATGVWVVSGSRGGVLRLAVEGSMRARGIVASNYAQPPDGDGIQQEIISIGDAIGFGIELGAADRYLIRGVSFVMDDSTPSGSGFTNPFDLRSGSLTGARQFSLTNTRDAPGLPVWTAQRGATVAGSTEYVFDQPVSGSGTTRRRDAILSRVQGAEFDGVDRPSAPGVSFTGAKGGDVQVDNPYMAVHGVPLYAMVQNLGQSNDGYRTVGSVTVKALTQGFTTGPDADGYELTGIGVNIEGSSSNFPDGPTSVSVSVHADSGGKPGAKLFDLVSPDEFAAGHSFFEAPRGTALAASTSYVMVWSHLGGTVHRLRKTGSNSEDSGARPGFSMANAFYQGADLDNLAVDTGSDVLEMAVYTDAPPPGNATGRPVVLASAQGAGILFADTEGIADEDGLPIVVTSDSYVTFHWSYQWIRVDGNFETNVGADSDTYQPVEADVGKLIKVEVSFTDGSSFPEAVTSLPFGPIAEPPPSGPTSTLVSNTGQSPSSTAEITQQYAVGFRLGDHGQGYEISSVSIDLAAVPSDLTVSLWSGGVEGGLTRITASKLFDFANPSSFAVGLNEFTAPAGAFAYQNVNYFIVLSGFGASLSIKETTSDNEDAGGEPGAVIYNAAAVRALSDTGVWVITTSRGGVLRLAVEGSMRARGIVASNFAQDTDKDATPQEIISVGDEIGFGIELGAADRYLIRGVSFNMDDSTPFGSGFTNPFVLRSGSRTGAVQFSLTNTRDAPGLPVWTAPQGSTVAGGCTTVMSVETCKEYVFDQPITADDGTNPRRDAILERVAGADSDGVDSPAAAGVSFTGGKVDVAINDPYMALLGEPLDAMVQNLGQTDNSYVSLGGSTSQVLSQGFTTGSNAFGYRLQGIGVNIEGSDDSNGNPQVPSRPTSVSVAVHADLNGQPGEKLFDLVSPGEFAAGHSFFEAPPGTDLLRNTSYVLVWSYLGGAWHRLQKTSSNSEDSGALTDTSIANAFRVGGDVPNLSEDSGGNSLEIAVYTEVPTRAPFVAGGIEVPLSWLHMPDGVEAGYQFRVLFVTNRGRLPTSGDIEEYNTWVQEEAAGNIVRGERVVRDADRYTDPVIWKNASKFRAVVCTAAVDARTNTGMTGVGVPVHWLDGGWEDRPTLVANSNAEFYGPKWVNTGYGAYVSGNSAHFEDHAMVWTGCDASGVAHPDFPMGATAMDMVAVGTPRGRSLKTREEAADSNFAPLGAVDVASGYAYRHFIVVINEGEIDEEELEILLPLYAISPIFTVVAEPEDD